MKTKEEIQDELAKEYGHLNWSAVKNKAFKGLIHTVDLVAFCDEANRRFYDQETAKLREALERIRSMKRLPGETDDKYAFNRCYKIADEALTFSSKA